MDRGWGGGGGSEECFGEGIKSVTGRPNSDTLFQQHRPSLGTAVVTAANRFKILLPLPLPHPPTPPVLSARLSGGHGGKEVQATSSRWAYRHGCGFESPDSRVLL